MKFQVWAEGYKGMTPTIPYLGDTVKAESFDEAVKIAVSRSKEWLGVDGPFHPDPKSAWDAYRAYWAKTSRPETQHDKREDRDLALHAKFITHSKA